MGRPVEPEVYIRQTGVVADWPPGRAGDAAAIRGPSTSSRTTAVPVAGSSSANLRWVTTAARPTSRTIQARRSSGKVTSSGTYTAPTLRTASAVTTMSERWSVQIPTNAPRVTPTSSRWSASRLARASRSP